MSADNISKPMYRSGPNSNLNIFEDAGKWMNE